MSIFAILIILNNTIKIMKKHMKQENRLWDFQILKELGKGEYGQVYQVKSKKDGKIYALKKINLANAHEKQKIQAYRQIKALKLIQHPHIIEYYESFLSMDNIYIITEFAEKSDLSKELRKRLMNEKKFKEEELWEIFGTLIEGLKHIHEKNIVHRDLKAQNIFLTASGVYKIGDLGMSKIVYQPNQMISTRVGTPIYFAPQIIQHRLYSFPVDIWALGCVFYYMAALEHPFKEATIETLGYYIIDQDLKPIKGPYSPQLISFITSMLDRNPQTRPTIDDLYRKLRDRKQTQISNKVSIFNLKQILYLKASRDRQINELMQEKRRLKKMKLEQEVESPILLHHHKNRVSMNPESSQKSQKNDKRDQLRNLSLILPKSNKIIHKKEMSPMIKTNGFTTNLVPIRHEISQSPRYGSVFNSPKKSVNLSKEISITQTKKHRSFLGA